MRISLNWLKELVDINLPPEDLAERLTLVGFEVEEIEDRRTWADGVVVGYVVSCEPHPNANKLSVCVVDIGADAPVNIVCGAPNIRADLWVAVATLGTYLPTIDLKIKKAKLRGVPSQGMICSLAEVGLAKESAGIHSFEGPSGGLIPGSDARPLLGLDDVVLDLTSTANRADALSMVGVAREVAAITGAALNLPATPQVEVPEQNHDLTVAIVDPQDCPAYIATVVEGVTITPSPPWLQQRLEAAGTRPLNNVVDITNYILLEWGQPLHAFDAEKLEAIAQAHTLHLGVRLARPQESLTTLDGQVRSLHPQALLITANDQPVALGGVMGGEDSEVQETTKTLVLEAALFNAMTVRRSARGQSLRTEASARYERGVNETQLDQACRHALKLLQELAGGQVVAQRIADHRTYLQRSIELRLDRVNQVLGPVQGKNGQPTPLSAQRVTEILQALGFELIATPEPQVWQVAVPSHRYRDIEREIDLVEEIARLQGYDQFCDTLPAKTALGNLSAQEKRVRRLRAALRAAGLTELLHYSWVKPEGEDQIQVVNPLLVEFSALRTEMLTPVINAFQYNLEQGNGPLNGFELGQIFWKEGESLQEARAIAGILGGDPTRNPWQQGIGQAQPLNWFEAKGILEAVFEDLGLQVSHQGATAVDPRLHPGRTAELWLHRTRLGHFGQLHPQLRQQRELPDEVYGFQLNLDVLLEYLAQHQPTAVTFQPYSSFPATDRDLAFFAATDVAVASLEQAIHKAAGQGKEKLLASVELIDEYRGESVPTGQRSLAFRLIYRASDRTLTEAEINPIHQQVRQALAKQFEVSLRS